MVYGEPATEHGHDNLVVDVHDSSLVKLGRKRIYHGPVGMVNSNIVWESEGKRIGMLP